MGENAMTDEETILHNVLDKTIEYWEWGYESFCLTFTDGTKLAVESSEWLRIYDETTIHKSETFSG